MRRWLLAVLALAGLPAAAQLSVGDLVQLSMQDGGASVTRELSGPAIDALRRHLGWRPLYGTARLLEPLAQEGCGRYAVTLVAGAIELGTVSLDVCPGGLPPGLPADR